MKLTMHGLGAAIVLTLSAGLAGAQSEMDTNGDGIYSFNELLASYPALTEETFGTIDVNGDGGVDDEELASAMEAGLLPAG